MNGDKRWHAGVIIRIGLKLGLFVYFRVRFYNRYDHLGRLDKSLMRIVCEERSNEIVTKYTGYQSSA